jgi:hypothetical protein
LELIYTDEYGRDIGVCDCASIDFSIGVENTFECVLPDELPIKRDCFLYVDMSDYGGIVDDIEADSSSKCTTYRGRTWEGVLEGSIIEPPASADHLVVSGDANAIIADILKRLQLDDFMAASSDISGIAIKNYQFDRYCAGYTGLNKMLASVDARLHIRMSGRVPVLSAEPIETVNADSDQVDITTKRNRFVNHLICLGTGENEERTVIHLYADEKGNISQAQTIFGKQHYAVAYDYSSADADELLSSGIEELQGYIDDANTCDISSIKIDGLHVGDVIHAYDNRHNASVTATVTEKIASIENGRESVELKAVGTINTN